MRKPSSKFLIRGARQLLTLRGTAQPRRGLALLDLGLIPDGAVLVANGLVDAVGPTRQVLGLSRARDADEIDATGRVVMPAFVDPSASLVQARPSARSVDRLARFDASDDIALLQELLRDGAHACASLSSQTLKRRASRVSAGMLHHGTGTVGSRAPYALDETSAWKVLRAQQESSEALQVVSTLLLDLPRESAPAYVERICAELMPRVRERRLATAIDLTFDAAALSYEHAARILETAAHLGFLTAVHADLAARATAVQLAIETGTTFVSGLRHITAGQIEALAASPTIALFRPGAAFQVGFDFHVQARALLDAGAIPALASAFHPELSPAYSMQMILLLASRLFRFTPEEAISAATINSAHALRLERAVGSLETGKQADLLVLNVSDYRELAYYPGINVVDKVMKRGRLVYDSQAEPASSSFENASA